MGKDVCVFKHLGYFGAPDLGQPTMIWKENWCHLLERENKDGRQAGFSPFCTFISLIFSFPFITKGVRTDRAAGVAAVE